MNFEYLLPAIVQPHEHISHSGLCNSRSASQVLVATSHLQTCYHHTSYRFSCDTCPSIGDGGSRILQAKPHNKGRVYMFFAIPFPRICARLVLVTDL